MPLGVSPLECAGKSRNISTFTSAPIILEWLSMGKNFSANNVTGNRRKSDFYETPYSMTRQFLDQGVLKPGSYVLEPACGNGAIVRVLEENGHTVDAYDKEIDFLTETGHYPVVITNPPYSLAQDFILKAKKVAASKICFLLPLAYLHGKQRFDTIYSDREFPLECVYVFTRYPMLGDKLREDGKYATGMMVYAWYVWTRGYKGEPVIRWIDNNSYVLNKADTR